MDSMRVWDRLSSSSAQVLLCDLQPQIVARSKTIAPEDLETSAGVLLRIARLFSLPTTLSVVPEQGRSPELIAELRGASDFAVQKVRASASPLQDPATVGAIEKNKRKLLVIGGFATEVVVLHAVLDFLRIGYDVVVPVDACGGMSDRTERATLAQIVEAGGITTSVVSIAAKLSPDFTTEIGKRMFEIVQDLRLA